MKWAKRAWVCVKGKASSLRPLFFMPHPHHHTQIAEGIGQT